jgi:zinc protease
MRRVDLDAKGDWPHDPSYKIGELENGLRYYIKINKTPKKKCELRLVVQAGSLHEEHRERGLAHFLEHLCFRKTKNFPDGAIIKMLEKQGVAFGPDVNAMTTFDNTIYQLTVPTDEASVMDQAFQVLGDWAGGVMPTEEALANEKKVVLEEWRQGQGSHHRISLQLIAEQLKGSRYPDRMPIGSFEVIENLTIEDVRRFYDRWYIPSRMAVVACGDFESFGQVQQLIERHLAAVTQRSSSPPPAPFDMNEYPVPVPKAVEYLIQVRISPSVLPCQHQNPTIPFHSQNPPILPTFLTLLILLILLILATPTSVITIIISLPR